jgi:threonine/homoserine/homoserine lactone efflux protein
VKHKEVFFLDYSEYFFAIGFMFFMCWSPGPNTMLCAAHGNQHGWKKSLPLEFGMCVGFFVMATIVGFGIELIEQYEIIIDAVRYFGSAYMLYLAWHIATARVEENTSEQSLVGNDNSDREIVVEGTSVDSIEFKGEKALGPVNGFFLQFVNPKGLVYFTLLMGVYGPRIGSTLSIKILLVFSTTLVGLGSVLFWSGAGVFLSRIFSQPESARKVNIVLGLILAFVALDIAFHENITALL